MIAAGSQPAISRTSSPKRTVTPSSNRPSSGAARSKQKEAARPWPRATVFQLESVVLGLYTSVCVLQDTVAADGESSRAEDALQKAFSLQDVVGHGSSHTTAAPKLQVFGEFGHALPSYGTCTWADRFRWLSKTDAKIVKTRNRPNTPSAKYTEESDPDQPVDTHQLDPSGI